MAHLQELSLAGDAETIALRLESIREELIGNFAAVNTEADAVLLETGRNRTQDLALRQRIISIQPELRSLLLVQVTALQYRRKRLLHDLPTGIAEAQRAFDKTVAQRLRDLAAERSTPLIAQPIGQTRRAFDALREEIDRHYQVEAGGTPSDAARAILSLSDSISSIVDSLNCHLDPLFVSDTPLATNKTAAQRPVRATK